MALRSHVDPVLYSRFVLLDESDIEAKYISALRTGKSDEVQQILRDLLRRYPRVAFHEAYHCFQGLRTPFLHRYALIAWYAFTQVFIGLCQKGAEDHRTWAVEVPIFGLLTRKIQYNTKMGGGIKPFAGQALTILDIVESITSLIEWQLYAYEHKQDFLDVALFQRWRKRNAMYSKLYDATSDVIGLQRALFSTVALGTASLYTSQPVQAYNVLLLMLEHKLRASNFRRSFDSAKPYVRSGLLFDLLHKIRYAAPVNATHDLLDTRLFRLKLPLDDSVPKSHPFLMHSTGNSGLFSATIDEKDGFMSLVHPEWLSDIRSLLEDSFVAPMTVVKVRLLDGTFRGGAMIHPQYEGTDESAQMAADFARYNSIIASVVRRASGRFYAEQRTCELHACPEWKHNFCSAYIFTPSHHTKCHFLLDLEVLRKGFRQ